MIALVLMLVLTQAKTTDDYIRAFRWDIGPNRVTQLARRIDTAAYHYDVDRCLLAALVRTESNFEPGIMMCWPVPGSQALTCDRGLGQINQVWIRTWGLNAWKLQYDDQYNLLVMARLLRQLEDQHPDDPEWFLYYHNRLPFYQRRYMKHLKPFLDVCTAATLGSGDPSHDLERPHSH